MILVTGTVVARPDTEAEVARLAVEHCRRSRAEPGCLHHAVHRDVEHPLRFVFVERWESLAALQVHFRVPASVETVQALSALIAEPPTMTLFQAHELRR
jgi:quinol monooxygenase YgiN